MADYAPIRVSTLRGDQKIPFDAYVHVAGKYILMCREGDSFEGDRIERLRGKKLVKMYIAAKKAQVYQDYLHENIKRAYEASNNTSLEIRTQIIHGALQAAAEDLTEDPESKALYNVALDGAKRFNKFFTAEPKSLEHLLAIKNVDFNIAHHGVIVAALSLAICQELGLVEARPMQIDAMLVGCLIHDIEHNYNNVGRSERPDLLGRAEKNIYLKHSVDGHDRIKGFIHFDPLVRDIILNHEEKIDMSGPRKRREKDLDVFMLVTATANAFDTSLTYEGQTPREALKKFLIDKMGVLQLETMHGLQNALKKRGLV